MPKDALPTFLIIGAMKCGTTSLHYYLRQHPQIQMPTMKETNFFAPPEGIPYYTGTKVIKTVDEYKRLFDSAFDVRGEASPSYTEYPRRKGVQRESRRSSLMQSLSTLCATLLRASFPTIDTGAQSKTSAARYTTRLAIFRILTLLIHAQVSMRGNLAGT